MAEYQTRFWIMVGQLLQARGCRVVMLSYDDNSTLLCRQSGLVTEGPTPADRAEAAAGASLDDRRFADAGIVHPARWFAHERVTFGIRDSRRLAAKLLMAFSVAERACRTAVAMGTPVMVQELGGFLSVLGAHFAARKDQIPDWFIEPSFFRGRLFYLRSTLCPPRLQVPARPAYVPEAEDALKEILDTKAIAIPSKDRHFYQSPASKVLTARNLGRLTQKLWNEKIRRRYYEFGSMGYYARRHLRMVLDSMRLEALYQPLPASGSFAYFPFHVPGDVALTLRSPAFLDQIALVDYIARCLPAGLRLVVKEHPAMIAALGYRSLARLVSTNDQICVVSPTINNHDLLAASRFVITVNSKSGAEALLHGKPVVALGEAFYSESGLVIRCRDYANLANDLERALSPEATPDPARTRAFLKEVWRQSTPGELYVRDPAAVQQFTDGLMAATRRDPAPC
ncbi:capsular polysaccharide export protein, LipB/KpsS family [Thermaurantiacus sp.]